MDLNQALNIFLNGIAGVFAGIFILYLAIRINAWSCRHDSGKTE